MELIGIETGETREGKAGATRHRVRLAVSESGAVVTIGDRRIATDEHTLVVWHRGSAGTWHGLRDVESLKTARASQAAPWQGTAVVETSSSGGADIAAAVIWLDVGQQVGIVTSGYKGRSGWHLLVYEGTPDGVRCSWSGHPRDWRAMHAPVEKLGGEA